MLALYDADKQVLASIPKTRWLTRFQEDGYYLDDLCSKPVNDLPPGERSRSRRAAVEGLMARITALSPLGVIVCHQGTYGDIADTLTANGVRVLHAKPIPFPLGNYRTEFARAVRVALR